MLQPPNSIREAGEPRVGRLSPGRAPSPARSPLPLCGCPRCLDTDPSRSEAEGSAGAGIHGMASATLAVHEVGGETAHSRKTYSPASACKPLNAGPGEGARAYVALGCFSSSTFRYSLAK